MASGTGRALNIGLLGDNVICAPDPRAIEASEQEVLLDALYTRPEKWACLETLGVDFAPDRITFNVMARDAGIDPFRSKYSFLMRGMELDKTGKYIATKEAERHEDPATHDVTIKGDVVRACDDAGA